MPPFRRAARALALLLAASLAVLATPVLAQNAAAPQPGCAGVALTDPAGDAQRITGQAGPESADITSVFFTYADGKAYANMQLVDAQDELAPGATGARWYISFKSGPTMYWVRATKTGPIESTFNYGHFDADESRVSDGDTEGTFFTGPNGVIQIRIPAEIGGELGKSLTSVTGETSEAVVNQLLPIDETRAGKAYPVGACETGQGPPGADPPATPPSAPQPDVVALQVAAPSKAKAKGRSLRLTVRSKDEVKAIEATLKKGAKVIGKGSLARLEGKGTLKLKLARKAKKGSYTLELTGTNPDGRSAALTTKLRLR